MREPYRRGREPEMDLPEGKTCGDCVHCDRCTQMYGHIQEDEVCDWAPSRFREKPTECPHCHQTALAPDINYLGRAHSCRVCGYWKEDVVTPSIDIPDRAAWVAAGPTKGNVEKTKKATARKIPCPVIGCGRTMMSDSPNGMCGLCSAKLREWQKGKKNTPAPVVQVDGVWYRAGKTAERSAA